MLWILLMAEVRTPEPRPVVPGTAVRYPYRPGSRYTDEPQRDTTFTITETATQQEPQFIEPTPAEIEAEFLSGLKRQGYQIVRVEQVASRKQAIVLPPGAYSGMEKVITLEPQALGTVVSGYFGPGEPIPTGISRPDL